MIYPFSLPQEIYCKHLEMVNGVPLTCREMEIIAYIMNGRGEKKIASCLSMDERAVSSHTSNIRRKLGCNSREAIIDFIERSAQAALIKDEYYQSLNNRMVFESELRKIRLPSAEEKPVCFIAEWKSPDIQGSEALKLKSHFKKQLLKHLEILPIKIGETSAKEYEDLSDLQRELTSESHRCHIVSLISHRQLNHILNQESIQESSPCLPTTFLILDEVVDSCTIAQEMKQTNITSSNNYYLSILSIVESLLPTANINVLKLKLNQQEHKLDVPQEKQPLEPGKIDHLKKESRLSVEIFLEFLSTYWRQLRWKWLAGSFLTFIVMLLFYFIGFYSTGTKFRLEIQNIGSGHFHTVRSEIILPTTDVLLNRDPLLKKIDETFRHEPKGLKVVVLVGAGGAGKTTLARHYAQRQKAHVIWEIPATTKASLYHAFKDLAYALSQTPEAKSDLEQIQKISDNTEQEKRLLFFVKKHLKEISSWLLIYDNVETLSEIKDFIPAEQEVWGTGKIILTTRDNNSFNTSYIEPKNVLAVDALSVTEAFNLFTKILYRERKHPLIAARREKIFHFLQHIPSFPLDISIAAYYIKSTQISLEQYLERIQALKNFEQSQAHLLKTINYYTKTRYQIVQTSLDKIIATNPELQDLLLFICLLGAQNIPRDLVEVYKTESLTDQLLYHLKTQGLITESASSSVTTFSMHPSVHQISRQYLLEGWDKEKYQHLLSSMIPTLVTYATQIREGNDSIRMRILSLHGENILAHHRLFSEEDMGNLKGELGVLYTLLGNWKKSQPLLQESLTYFNKNHIKNNLKIAQTLTYLGYIHRGQSQYLQAKEFLEQALTLHQQHLPNNHIKIAEVLDYLGRAYSSLGEYQKSLDSFQQSIKIYQGSNHQLKVAKIYVYLANVYRRLGKYQQAKNLLEESLNFYQKSFPESYFDIALASVNLGKVYRELGENQKAQSFTEQGLQIYQQYFSTDYSKIAWALTALGSTYHSLKKYDAAISMLQQSIRLYQDHLPNNILKLHETFIIIAKVYSDLGDFDKAQGMLEASLKVFENHYGREHFETRKVYLELARLFSLKENHASSKKLTQKVQAIFQ